MFETFEEFREVEMRKRYEKAVLRELGMVDIRELGCPEDVFRRVFEDRMKKRKLRSLFTPDRVRETAVVPMDLDAQIAGNKLF